MKQTRNKILYIIFLATIIPTIVVYIEHAAIEFKAHNEAISETKKTKTFAETIFFYAIGQGYILAALYLFVFPKSRIPYIILIIGTVAIVIFYYLSRIYPVPIPFTDIVIVDRTFDHRDVVTKICQSVLLPVVTWMLAIRSGQSYRLSSG